LFDIQKADGMSCVEIIIKFIKKIYKKGTFGSHLPIKVSQRKFNEKSSKKTPYISGECYITMVLLA